MPAKRKPKHRTRRQRIEPRAPMLVIMSQIPDLSLTEQLSVEAFCGGYANVDHFDNLADCRDILTLAAAERDDKATLAICELAYIALTAIKQRHAKQRAFGATGEELKALRALADTSEDFWLRQSGATFTRHYHALKAARKIQKGCEA